MSSATHDFSLIDDDGNPAPVEQWFYTQHAPELDGSTLYVYDNGKDRPGEHYSRVVAFDVDLTARTLHQTWEWRGDGWYEPIWGDVDLLPNGHLLVTRGHCDDCGADPVPTSWVELDPGTGPVWELDTPTLGHMGYRAERLDGCAVFANAEYCPSLLE
jgi:hypothetical protein